MLQHFLRACILVHCILRAASEALQKEEVPDSVSSWSGRGRCTTIVVGKEATADGSVMTTHNNDCGECDFRVAKVPAMDWPAGSMRPVYSFYSAYPKRVQLDRGATWSPDNLETELPQRDAWIRSMGISKPIGYIPQVNHTYALVEGLYGMMNEHQVAIGESTCPAKLLAKPVHAGGHALLEVAELSLIGLERCKTARCAIETMGSLSEQYGFYPSDYEGPINDRIAEAGEALTVADAHEAWIFHIIPDDTGRSAVWVAQRVPRGHITLIANQFIIRKVRKGHADFMYSSNLWDVARRSILWNPEQGDLDFLRTFGVLYRFSPVVTRRTWRVFTLAAPSLRDKLPADTNAWGDAYPFSVKPDKPLTPQDIMRMQRDHFEGTEYDLSKGIAAGPHGYPVRYDGSAKPEKGLTLEVMSEGGFERPVSMMRTVTSTITQSRAHLPTPVAARMWLCQYMPSMSVYTPVYISAPQLPQPYTVGSLWKYTRRSMFWAGLTVGNWAALFYSHIRKDVEEKQKDLEGKEAQRQVERAEAHACQLLSQGRQDDAYDTLAKLANDTAQTALDTWNGLFEDLIARYRDGYRISCPMDATVFAQDYMFYPLWWLRDAGFFHQQSGKLIKEQILVDTPPKTQQHDAQAGERAASDDPAVYSKMRPGSKAAGDGTYGRATAWAWVIAFVASAMSMAVGFLMGSRTLRQRRGFYVMI